MGTPLNALVVEDAESDAALLVHHLESAGFDLKWTRVQTEVDFIEAVARRPDIILSDFSMPQFSVKRALELLKQNNQDVPFIVVSGTIGEDAAVETLKGGATDYILKDRLSRLGPAIRRALREADERAERKRAEKALEAARSKLERVLAHSPAVTYSLKLNDGQVVSSWVSDNIGKLLGYAPSETSDHDWWTRHIHPADRPRVVDKQAHLLACGHALKEYRFQRKDGTYIWISDEQRLLSDAAGQAVEVVGVWTDITDRRRAEETLRESEERFRELAENIREVFWLIDPVNKQLLYVSPAYESVWGRPQPATPAPATAWLQAIHPEDRERVSRAFSSQETTGTFEELYRILRPDDTMRWVRDRAYPVRTAAGQICRIVGVAEDITDRTNLEAQLRQAQKMESVGQLAGGVAHDFNNILTVIQGHASLLLAKTGVKQEWMDSVEQISLASERAASLTRQLLTFSRKQVIQPRRLDLNEVIGNMIKMLKRILREDVLLRVNYASNLPSVLADTGMLEQVLMNLAVNARDAMPHGGELVISTSDEEIDVGYIELNPQAQLGKYVCLAVGDTGSGIPAEIQPRIFEPFFTTKAVGKGTGLGLATVYGIVKQHGGWITVYSETGKGSLFRVYLPVAKASEKRTSDSAKERDVPGGTETILLVEDEKPVRQLARSVLERLGYRVIEAESGMDAIILWSDLRNTVDLLLTDMVMPGGMTGLELAKRLRTDKPDLRIIYTSGYSVDIIGKDFELQDGMNFLQKPFGPRKLAQTVRDALKRERS